MSLKIADGKGRGSLASVSDDQRLNTASKAAPRAFYVSRDSGSVFSWTSAYSATSTDEIIYIKNTNKTKDLYIDQVRLSAAAGAAVFTLYEVTGTAAGTSITGKNLNLKSGNVADVTSYGDASVTGLTIGDRIAHVRDVANGSVEMDLGSALILGFNDAIAITFVGTGGLVEALVRGFFEEVV